MDWAISIPLKIMIDPNLDLGDSLVHLSSSGKYGAFHNS